MIFKVGLSVPKKEQFLEDLNEKLKTEWYSVTYHNYFLKTIKCVSYDCERDDRLCFFVHVDLNIPTTDKKSFSAQEFELLVRQNVCFGLKPPFEFYKNFLYEFIDTLKLSSVQFTNKIII